ncbi:hypothetical protein F5876DRAFT_84183 [Lentinula aff. lateritia]|uniref:Uncharacterized protein n=1 Tax=Lentinula aff. lateritia TaxID=2804960 RepID=A0ACC1TH15_9AGAR|nr:hypothetical protein F5876DRAFT_84183 [Lentinula aff. lateritia]
MLGKAARFPISKIRASLRVEKFGDVFHMDVWRPASVQMLNHYAYMLTVIDKATSWFKELLMKGKDESFAQYIVLQTGLQTQYGIMVKKLHSVMPRPPQYQPHALTPLHLRSTSVPPQDSTIFSTTFPPLTRVAPKPSPTRVRSSPTPTPLSTNLNYLPHGP